MRRMLIGELARRSGVPPKTLRFYEGAGLLRAVPRRSNGYRDYDERVLGRLRLIGWAQAAGLSLSEIGFLLAATQDDDRLYRPFRECALVEDVLVRVDRRMVQLRAFRRKLLALPSQTEGG